MELNGTTARFVKSAETIKLLALLSAANVGQVVTYEDMSAAIGRNVREFDRAAIYSARRMVQAEYRFVFATVTNVGLKRLSDNEIVELSGDDRTRIRKTVKRGLQRLAVTDYAKLDDKSRHAHLVASAQLAAAGAMVEEKAAKRIASKVTPGSGIPAIGETLKMFT